MQRIWLKDRDDHLRADVSETDISERVKYTGTERHIRKRCDVLSLTGKFPQRNQGYAQVV